MSRFLLTLVLFLIPGISYCLLGPTQVCVGSTYTYTAQGSNLQTGYTWSIPTGATIISGSGSKSIKIRFNSFRMGNYIGVTGNGINEYLIVHALHIPSVGPITGLTKVKPGDNGVIYSVPPIPMSGVTYNWMPPTGATVINNGPSAKLNFNSSFTGGKLTFYIVVAGCGISDYATLPIGTGNCPVTLYTIGNGNWSNPQIWSDEENGAPVGCYPQSHNKAIITNYDIIINTNQSCSELQIVSNKEEYGLTINSGKLTVIGTVDITGGSLVLEGQGNISVQ